MKLLNIIKKIISYHFIILNMAVFRIIKPKTLIVLGMHRSGTSCITRILNQNGLTLGKELIQPDEGNPQGYWENLAVYWINERILKKSNGRWDNPPQTVIGSLYIHLEILRVFYNRNWRQPHLIIKDPRLVLTWDIWKKHLRIYHILAVFRNPDSVAKSLNRRDGMDNLKGLSLWENYNEKIINIQKNESMMFLDFDDATSFDMKIKTITDKMDLEFNPKSLAFYNPNFKTSDSDNPSVKNDLYTQLNQLTI